jgi:hypothetical protein
MMNETIPMAFLETLGDYNYSYGPPDKPYYVGKGRGNRCLEHIKSKGYSIDDLWIIARNLEQFTGKDYSFAVESLLITILNPRDNKIPGHYKECFVMAKLSDILGEWQEDQLDNMEALPAWYVDNYEFLRGKAGKINMTPSNTDFESVTRSGLGQIMWKTEPNGDVTEVTFKLTKASLRDTLFSWLETCGFSESSVKHTGSGDMKDRRFSVKVREVNDALHIMEQMFE